MIFPLVEETNKIHIVKSKYRCLCGLEFNDQFRVSRKTLRKIKFTDIENVTCEKCISLGLNL